MALDNSELVPTTAGDIDWKGVATEIASVGVGLRSGYGARVALGLLEVVGHHAQLEAVRRPDEAGGFC